MRRMLFVKSGKHENPVTKTTEVDEPTIVGLVNWSGALRYLGDTLSPLGEASKLGAFAGPDHVVLQLPADGLAAKLNGAGFYLVPTIHPSDLTLRDMLDRSSTWRRAHPEGGERH